MCLHLPGNSQHLDHCTVSETLSFLLVELYLDYTCPQISTVLRRSLKIAQIGSPTCRREAVGSSSVVGSCERAVSPGSLP